LTSPEDAYIEKLILAGAIEVSGVYESGNFTYSFTEKIHEIDEALKQKMDAVFLAEVKELWELGFLNMNITEYNPIVHLTGKAMVESERLTLHPNLQDTLEYIMNILKR
jgi:hypothetical protein